MGELLAELGCGEQPARRRAQVSIPTTPIPVECALVPFTLYLSTGHQRDLRNGFHSARHLGEIPDLARLERADSLSNFRAAMRGASAA